MLSIGGIGAPAVSIEKLEEGTEGVRVLRCLEEFLDVKINALISAEIGGGNGLEPMMTAAALDLPVVDADGMGRAFPEMQMTTFCIYGHRSTPAAICDEHGNLVLFQACRQRSLVRATWRAPRWSRWAAPRPAPRRRCAVAT